MRPAQFASLLALLLMAAGLHAQAPEVQRGRGRTERQTQARTVDQKTATWEVTGFGETVEDADRNALRDARTKIFEHFQQKGVQLEFDLTLDYIGNRLVKQRTELEPQPLDPDHQVAGAKLGVARQRKLRVELTSRDESEILAQDRQVRVQHLQMFLFKVLAGILARLAAVSVYFRLEEATKGYYTGWLRVAAAGLVVGVGACLWRIS